MKNFFRFSCAVLLVLALSFPVALAESGQKLSPTTGLPTDKEYKPIMASLDNEPAARPQIGMSKADIVFEFQAYNNGYTRYLAVFNDEAPKTVEGFRSTRIPALQMYWNFGGAVAHYGGLDTTDANIYTFMDQLKVTTDYNGIKGDSHFHRDSKRKAPHNAVGELKDMQDDMAAVDEVHMLSFSADNPTVKGDPATEFGIAYRKNGGYYPTFKYDAKKNVYDYYFNGKQVKDGADSAKLQFSNVIVIHYDYRFAENASCAPIIDTTGEHAVDYFIGGKHFTGSYNRGSLMEPIKFLDDEGGEVQFLPGKTFIEMPDSSQAIDYIA